MRPLGIRFHPAAAAELAAVLAWYSARSPVAAERFELAIQTVMDGIALNPERGRVVRPGVRRVVMRPFPYTVIYRVKHDGLEVQAFAHTSRKLGYWADRIQEPDLAYGAEPRRRALQFTPPGELAPTSKRDRWAVQCSAVV